MKHRERTIRVIKSCKTRDQLRSAMKYIELAGLGNDKRITEILRHKVATID